MSYKNSKVRVRPQIWLLDIFSASHRDDRRADMIQFQAWTYTEVDSRGSAWQIRRYKLESVQNVYG